MATNADYDELEEASKLVKFHKRVLMQYATSKDPVQKLKYDRLIIEKKLRREAKEVRSKDHNRKLGRIDLSPYTEGEIELKVLTEEVLDATSTNVASTNAGTNTDANTDTNALNTTNKLPKPTAQGILTPKNGNLSLPPGYVNGTASEGLLPMALWMMKYNENVPTQETENSSTLQDVNVSSIAGSSSNVANAPSSKPGPLPYPSTTLGYYPIQNTKRPKRGNRKGILTEEKDELPMTLDY
ncbi:unnamed protein product [Kuraishia capsulata CBS 1993]|uniref:Uncharacterized protein n=1 Tax=Kuraishia capsulata CBS 1993 TaxID=1382522 RepID=W6MGL7_9ASCO|nr:uncharacterized protein KUCA_T00001251001 [Kuraishia capsulata CBS 1993]CDK25284.1 unnamed protein product [Kuraishia capsulata CBS 1993]